MTHPRYDASDPKAGQPVLVGDEWYNQHGNKNICLCITDKHIGGTGGFSDINKGPFFSAPPTPRIEACACGQTCGGTPSSVDTNGDSAPSHPYGTWWVQCYKCHRRGPNVVGKAEAIAAWNADAVKLKAK
jgi:hypothetical protein